MPPDFQAMYDEYYGPVRTFLAGLVRDEWEADDLVQETFVRVQKSLAGLRDEARVKSWIFSIAANAARDYFRRRTLAGRKKAEAVRLVELEDAPRAHRRLERSEMSRCVQDKMKLLSDGQREVLILFDVLGFSHREAADALGLTVSNVKIRLHRARRALREILERECLFERDEGNVLVCLPKPASESRAEGSGPDDPAET